MIKIASQRICVGTLFCSLLIYLVLAVPYWQAKSQPRDHQGSPRLLMKVTESILNSLKLNKEFTGSQMKTLALVMVRF